MYYWKQVKRCGAKVLQRGEKARISMPADVLGAVKAGPTILVQQAWPRWLRRSSVLTGNMPKLLFFLYFYVVQAWASGVCVGTLGGGRRCTENIKNPNLKCLI